MFSLLVTLVLTAHAHQALLAKAKWQEYSPGVNIQVLGQHIIRHVSS